MKKTERGRHMLHAKKKDRKTIYWVLMLSFLVIQAYPILWLIVASIRPNMDLAVRPFSIPSAFTLENYVTVFTNSNVLTYIKNSGVVSIISIILIVALSSMVSFAISK